MLKPRRPDGCRRQSGPIGLSGLLRASCALRCHAEGSLRCDVPIREDHVVMKWKSLSGGLAITLLGSVALLLLIAAGLIVTQVAEIYLAAKRGHNQVVLL